MRDFVIGCKRATSSWLCQIFPHFNSSEKCGTKWRSEETLDFMARDGHGSNFGNEHFLPILTAFDSFLWFKKALKNFWNLPYTDYCRFLGWFTPKGKNLDKRVMVRPCDKILRWTVHSWEEGRLRLNVCQKVYFLLLPFQISKYNKALSLYFLGG